MDGSNFQHELTNVDDKKIAEPTLLGVDAFISGYKNHDLQRYLAQEAEIKAKKEARFQETLTQYAKSIVGKDYAQLSVLEKIKYDVARQALDMNDGKPVSRHMFRKMVKDAEQPVVAEFQTYLMKLTAQHLDNGQEVDDFDGIKTDKASALKTLREIEHLNPDMMDQLMQDEDQYNDFIFQAHQLVNDDTAKSGKRTQLKQLLNQSAGYPEFDQNALEQRINELNRYTTLAQLDETGEVEAVNAKNSKRIASFIATELPDLADEIMNADKDKLSFDGNENMVVTALHDIVAEVSSYMNAKTRSPSDVENYARAIQADVKDVKDEMHVNKVVAFINTHLTNIHTQPPEVADEIIAEIDAFIAEKRPDEAIEKFVANIKADYELDGQQTKPAVLKLGEDQRVDVTPTVVQEEPNVLGNDDDVIASLRRIIGEVSQGQAIPAPRITAGIGPKTGANTPSIDPVNKSVPGPLKLVGGHTRSTRPAAETESSIPKVKRTGFLRSVSQKPLAWAAAGVGLVAVAALAVTAYMAPSQSNNNVDVAAQAGADAPAVAAATEAPRIPAAPEVTTGSLTNPFGGVLPSDLLPPRAEPLTGVTDGSAPLATPSAGLINDVALPSYDGGVRQETPSQIANPDLSVDTLPEIKTQPSSAQEDFATVAKPDGKLLEAVAQVKAQKEQDAHDRWLEAMEKQYQQAQQAAEPAVTDSLSLSFGDIEPSSDTQVVLYTGTPDIVSEVEDLYNSFDGTSVPDDMVAKLVALQAGIGQKLDHMRTIENDDEVILKAAEARQYDAMVGDALNIASTLIENLSTEVALDTAILIVEEATRGLSADGSMANTRQALRDNGDLAYYKTTQKMIADGDASDSMLVNDYRNAEDTHIANIIQQRQADTRMAAITSNHDAAMAAMGGENGQHYGFSVIGSAKAGFDNVNNSVAKGSSSLSIEITEGVRTPKGLKPNS
jgi:hypothetical protein